MTPTPLTIWCNAHFPTAAEAELARRTGGHKLIFPDGLQKSNLAVGGADPLLEQADIAFGQPDPGQAMKISRLKWVHLTTAGYTRYDRDDLRQAFVARGAMMTNSSSVYAEPCAEHVFSMMLAFARQLPQCVAEQLSDRAWRQPMHRERSRLLVGQNVLILGLGAIGSRVVEMLEPFKMNVTAVRRNATGKERCKIIKPNQVNDAISAADHVLNILPSSPATDGFLNRDKLARMKPSAILYNIGRGTTIDQAALVEVLQNGKIAGAYLDVTDPEPLPADHPLWKAPNCYITPHTAGGHDTEFDRLVSHFADNLDRYVTDKTLIDRII